MKAVVWKGKRGTKAKALNNYRKLRQEFQLPIYIDDDTAAVDFHWARSSIVFIPTKEMLTTVKNRELLEFLTKVGVKRVVFDSLYPSHVELLKTLCEAGLEVEAISRPTACCKKEAQQLMRAIIPTTKKSPTDFDEVRLELFAASFVESVMKNYPEYEIGKLFERLEVGDDAIKEAFI
jgi:hypothetical protein